MLIPVVPGSVLALGSVDPVVALAPVMSVAPVVTEVIAVVPLWLDSVALPSVAVPALASVAPEVGALGELVELCMPVLLLLVAPSVAPEPTVTPVSSPHATSCVAASPSATRTTTPFHPPHASTIRRWWHDRRRSHKQSANCSTGSILRRAGDRP